MRCRIEDLPPRLQQQVRAKLGIDGACADGDDKHVRARRVPNKTEAEYARIYLAGKDARYEAITFRLENGHRYTPDWIVFEDGRPVEAHEVKGAHVFSRDSRIFWDQASIEWPGMRWVWAQKTKDGWTRKTR